jgi:hypothetical protein
MEIIAVRGRRYSGKRPSGGITSRPENITIDPRLTSDQTTAESFSRAGFDQNRRLHSAPNKGGPDTNQVISMPSFIATSLVRACRVDGPPA